MLRNRFLHIFAFAAVAVLLPAAVLMVADSAAAESGGPDARGYRWDDSGAPYATIIPDSPDPTKTLRLAQDEDSDPIDISPLGFEYYDLSINQVFVNNNGFLSFSGTTAAQANAAHQLPDNTQSIGQMVAGCWTPFKGDEISNPSPNPGTLYYDLFPDRFVVQWTNYEQAGSSAKSTFQIILYDDGRIDVAIKDCPGPATGRQSSGIEDHTGDHGLNYRYTPDGLALVSIRYHPNRAPEPEDDLDLDAFATPEDTAIILDVLDNDAEPDDDTLSITATTDGTHGKVVSVSGGTKLRYTPNTDTNDDFRGGERDLFTYTVSDPYGKTATATVNVSVTPVNDAPEFSITGDVLTSEDTNKTSTGWLSSVRPGPATATDEVDQELNISLHYLGGVDGLLAEEPSLDGTGPYDLSIKPATDANGIQTWQLNVSENASQLVTTKTFLVTVSSVNDPPTFEAVDANVQDPGLGPVRNPMVAEGSGPFTFTVDEPWARAPRPGPATATDEADQGTYYTVDVDDPTLFAQQPKVDAQGRLTFRIAPDRHGASDINVTVWDDAGTSDPADDVAGQWHTGTITAWPVNDPPTAVDDKVVYLIGQGDLFVDVLANDDDHPDTGETLRLTEAGAIVDVDHASATAARHNDTHLRFRLDDGLAGTVRVTYRVTDDGETSDGGAAPVFDPQTATAVLEVTLTTIEKIGVADHYDVQEDGRLDIHAQVGVLANDAAPAGLTPEVALAEGPRFGDLTLRADGSFTYKPTADFQGVDTFAYDLTIEGAGRSPPIPVTVQVAPTNDHPIALMDLYVIAPGETFISPPPGVLGNDVDADGDDMEVRIVHDADHGKLELREDGSFKYTPPAGFLGLDVFLYEVRDRSGWGGSAEVRLQVRENKAPFAEFTTDRRTTAVALDPKNPEDPHAVMFSDLSVDPDGDIVRWRWDFGNGDVRQTQHVSYAFAFPGEYRIKLTVWDEAGASSTVGRTYIVTEKFNAEEGGSYTEAPPRAHAGEDRIVLQDTRVRLGCVESPELRCADNFLPKVLGHHWEQVGGPAVEISDPDARHPTFQAPKVPVDGQVTLTFSLTIFDGQHISAPEQVNITVQDRILRPIANAGNNITVLAGQVVNLNGKAVGFDEGVNLTYTWRQVDDGCGNFCPQVTAIFHGQGLGFRAPDLTDVLQDQPGVEEVPLRFALTVSDGVRTTQPDEVVVTVRQVPQILSFQHRAGIGADALIVQFAPRQTEVPRLVSSHWDFGDGATSDAHRPVHGYAEPGTYTVTWTLTLSDGRIQTFEKAIEVGAAPVAGLDPARSTPGAGPAAIVVALAAAAIAGVAAARRRN